MTHSHRHPEPPDPQVPPRLAEALRELDSAQPITTGLDARVRAQADRLADPIRLPVRRVAFVGGALAAGLALALVFWPQLSRPRSSGVNTPSIAGDLDRDGRVTVLDAYAVARGVRTGRVDPAWDANADGTVDLADAEALATIAVRLGPVDADGGAG